MFECRYNGLIIEFDPRSIIKEVINFIFTASPMVITTAVLPPSTTRIAIDTVAFLLLVTDSDKTVVMTSIKGPAVAQNGMQMIQVFR